MWPTLDRTRRRILRSGPRTNDATSSKNAPGEPADATTGEILIAIGRAELDRLVTALQLFLGPDTARPDTPARLEAALATAIGRRGGHGHAKVTRRPAGLYTPEAWQLRLTAVDTETDRVIRDAIRDGAFAR
jgi:hypothetical protein